MITIQTTTSINEEEFDKIYADSLDALNNGSYPWEAFPLINTDEGKKTHIRKIFDFSFDSEMGIVFETREDDLLLGMACGYLLGEGKLRITMGLMSPNAAGSKSYAYSPEGHTARTAYFNSIGVNSFTYVTAGPESPFYKHMYKRLAADTESGLSEKNAPKPALTDADGNIIRRQEDIDKLGLSHQYVTLTVNNGE